MKTYYIKPKRYCELDISRLFPCSVGWGSIGDDGVKACTDEPMESNCHCIVTGVERTPALKLRYIYDS